MKDQLSIAIKFAIEAHGDQKYGNSDQPYVVHLAQVDRQVVKHYGPKDLKHSDPYSKEPGDEMDKLRAIAFLHDVLEDTDKTAQDMRDAGLCEEVILACECISKIEGQPYGAYIDVVCSNELARKVKLCDTSANLWNSIQEASAKRVNKYTKQIQLLGGF